MIYFFLLTTITVSIDSFVCGFTLSFNKGKKLHLILGIALTVFIMCLIANYFGMFFSDYLNEKTAGFGGIILIGIGIWNLVKKDKASDNDERGILKQSILTGFAVGLDGALGNLSLSLMGFNGIYVPITIAIMHALLISLGILLSQKTFAKRLEKYTFIPPTILILLGVYKVLGIFI